MTGVYQLLTHEPQTIEELLAQYTHRRRSMVDSLRLLVKAGKCERVGEKYKLPAVKQLTVIEQAVANRTPLELAWKLIPEEA